LEDRQNVWCVLDARQQLVGFAPMFPVLTTDAAGVTGPHEVWLVILARPDDAAADTVRDLLFTAVLQRAAALKAAYGLAHLRLAADMMVSQEADIAYLAQKGFAVYEQMLVMRRDTAEPIPDVSIPAEIAIRPSRLETAASQAAYLAAYNVCFPDHPKTVDELQFLLQSPLWRQGQVIAAYTPAGEIAGSIMLYRDPQEAHGVLDDVLVLPAWRGRGIARRLVGEGLRFFRARGVPEVRLEVRASNAPAVAAYRAMGYRVVNQEHLLARVV
ncbi:MAG: GNAT family N-acetyltransferase, partial [Anaerolineales bacterium]|nr:GNAT family N-acetyltransferase [Anaerolineales bacterium]